MKSSEDQDARAPVKGCGTFKATAPPRTMSRVQTCVATDSEDVLHLRVGEGRDRMVKRGRCASWCLSLLMVVMALQGESRSGGASLSPPWRKTGYRGAPHVQGSWWEHGGDLLCTGTNGLTPAPVRS